MDSRPWIQYTATALIAGALSWAATVQAYGVRLSVLESQRLDMTDQLHRIEVKLDRVETILLAPSRFPSTNP